jgi:MFS family permease
MLVCGWIALGSGAPLALRFGAVMAFSAVGGLIPGTVFATIPAFSPHAGAVSTTSGLVQQGSSLGQLAAPPMLAAVAAAAGGWHRGWLVTGAFACADLLLAAAIARRDQRARREAADQRKRTDTDGLPGRPS